PTAFSPNGDNINDDFMIYSNEDVIREIRYFRIFDRWGAVVHEGFGGLPNEEDFSWDGTHKGEKLNPGVFVYVAEVVLNNGIIKVLKGDVTLMK
ncbi:MAG: gliding motility-associated C-terminal domain-containing protein, partial [Saprospiraceae bacterium]